ncbi:BMP family ABC transporter substrate-binding protein [Modestobacter sp. NPDC049651]|uniref:BMP family lipoprotein n=1 Tax=unclassified Modestobacter TaxID=2643866 RepID=UPI0033E34EF6
MRHARGMKAAALLLAGGLALAACASDDSDGGSGSSSGGGSDSVKIGLAYDTGGRGDKSFNDSAYAGVEAFVSAHKGSKVQELSPNADASNRADLLTQLADQGFNPVIAVGFNYADVIGDVAKQYPDTSFAVVDSTGVDVADNVTGLQFASNEGSFLGGVAAALKTTTKHVGYIGGVESPLLQSFEAGYVAGVKAVDPAIQVDVQYLSPNGDFSGFSDPAKGQIVAQGMYDSGADIIYAAAGGSGIGVFQAAKASNKRAIGVDSDQYQTVGDPSLQPVIMTSVLKRVDNAVQAYIEDFADGGVKGGQDETYDLKSEGVGLSTSGGFIDDIKTQIDDYTSQITSGKIKVPSKP